MTLALRLMTRRAGLAVVLCALLWGWHVHDKSQAITAARDGYVLQVELAAAQVELAELRRRAFVADEANRVLQENTQESEGEALQLSREIKDYADSISVKDSCVPDDHFLDGLRTF